MYLKEPAGNGRFTIIPLTIDNVFSICPICGTEHQIDITDLTGLVMMEADAEYISLQVCCPCCTRKVQKEGLSAALMERGKKVYQIPLDGKERKMESDYAVWPCTDSAGGIGG